MYEKGHLLSWLKYRGDSLKSLGNIKHIRCRVLHYFKNNIDNNIVDPTSDLKWKTRKVELLGKKLLQKNPTVSEVPEVLRGKLGPLTSTIGWVKSLEGLPRLTINEIELYLEKVSSKNAKKFTSVKIMNNKSIDHQPIPHQFCVFPDFPMHESPNLLDSYLNGLSDSEQKFIETLQVTSDQVDTVEKGTRDQANNPDWFKYRKGRFTASLNNVYRNKTQRQIRVLNHLPNQLLNPVNIRQC